MKLVLAIRNLRMVKHVVLSVLIMLSVSVLFFNCSGGNPEVKPAVQEVSAKSLSRPFNALMYLPFQQAGIIRSGLTRMGPSWLPEIIAMASLLSPHGRA